MIGPIISGNPAPIQGPTQTVWRKRGGSEFIHSWVGPAESVRAMEASLRSSGAIEVEVSQDIGSALARIRAQYAAPVSGEVEQIEESLTIDFSDETFPINVHPAFINIADDIIQILEEQARDSSVTIDDTTGDATGQYYMKLIRRGETTYRAALPSLVYTRNTPDNTVETLDVQDNGKVFTKAEVAGFIAAPIVFAIPDANVGAVAGSHYAVGYRFSAQMEFTSNGRLNLIERYTFGRWENVLYGLSSIT